MPGRKIPLVEGEIYHVFNRGISLQPTFYDQRDFQRFLYTMIYYRNCTPPMKFSLFLTSSQESKSNFIERSKTEADFLIEIICYCLMSNHFHLLLRQLVNGGISHFLSNLTNSYTRYLNTRQKRVGPFFQGKFKAVRIESNNQLLHMSRYIHLNPLTSYLVKDLNQLEIYPYSSFPEYLDKTKNTYCQKDIILTQFKSKELYKKFVFDQADYQRKLDRIKHLTFEEK